MTQRETDHPTPATPEATEREAREACWKLATDLDALRSFADVDAALDAYAAAVRRAERERIGQIVEGMENTDNPWRDSSVDLGRDSHDDGFDAACAALLDRLREGA